MAYGGHEDYDVHGEDLVGNNWVPRVNDVLDDHPHGGHVGDTFHESTNRDDIHPWVVVHRVVPDVLLHIHMDYYD